MKSATQLKRLLNLVPYLVAHQGVAVEQVASHFQVTEKQILADLEILQFCGLPDAMYGDLFEADIDGARMDGHIFFRNADVLARPMRLNRQEATSLLLALQAVAEVSGESVTATAVMDKLRGALGTDEQVISLQVTSGQAQHREALRRAIEDHHAVRLTYSGAGRTSVSQPVVEPARLRVVDSRVYLDAWSRLRGDWRSYRLDRIDALDVLEDSFEPRTPPEAEGFFAEVEQDLTLTLGDAAEWVPEYYPVRSSERTVSGVRVTLPVASREWATALLLRLGDAVIEVEPTLFADAAAAEARATLRYYG